MGETVTGTITGNERECSFTTVAGGWGGPCQGFEITVPSSGVLTTTAAVRSPANANLQLYFKTATGGQIDMADCCGSSPSLRVPVEADTTNHVELVGHSGGYPITPIEYTLDTALLTGADARSTGTIRAIIFAEKRSNWMARARLEVVDGPKAGAVAVFDPSSGIYEIRNVPSGIVQVSVSAEGFNTLASRVPVGVNVATEFVLQRSVPVADATNNLSGITYASPSKPGGVPSSAYSGVKVEILDGPLAGIFTFSDEVFGGYQISGVPPGPIHVRASADHLEPQTLEVVVSGITKLDFVMKRP